MNVKLLAAAIAALGLAACAPDVTPDASSAAAQTATEKQAVQTPAPAPAAQEAKNDEVAASMVAAKTHNGAKKTD